uniref:sigma-54-dependent Fis family transcriptional regulator n=1 Tax=Roseiarcus sp. TaxID=1969460 RepID=UPI003F991621
FWPESIVGTNGIGTAIVERRAVSINGEEHYHASLKQFICCAAPLFDPEGALLGVIDFSGYRRPVASEAALLLQVIGEAADHIEATAFRRHFSANPLVVLTDSPSLLPRSFNTVLALDDRGRVLGASERAVRLLGAPDRSSVIGRSVESLLGVDAATLERSSGRMQRLEAACPSAGFAFALPSILRSTPRRAERASDVEASGAMTLDDLAGEDPKARECVRLGKRIADSDIPVLVEGETGVGKDVFARALHTYSSRRAKRFVALNCAALPDSLVDSELFGYAPGTFTGGLKAGKIGKILASDGGTLFLDEIGDMPLELQARLLRAIEDREVTPLGAVEPVKFDLRLVCATNRNLQDLVATGRFREDLYYRICGARFVLPALRRRLDFSHIVSTLLVRFSPASRRTTIEPAALARLQAYDWPGNIRQLSSVIRLAIAISDGVITVADLPAILPALPREPDPAPQSEASSTALRTAMTTAGWEAVLAALRSSGGNVSAAARSLGVSRATLHRMLRSHNVERPLRAEGV